MGSQEARDEVFDDFGETADWLGIVGESHAAQWKG
jgi:hypothetical protein